MTRLEKLRVWIVVAAMVVGGIWIGIWMGQNQERADAERAQERLESQAREREREAIRRAPDAAPPTADELALAEEKRMVLAGVLMTRERIDMDATGEEHRVLRIVAGDCSMDTLDAFLHLGNRVMLRDAGFRRVVCVRSRKATAGLTARDL